MNKISTHNFNVIMEFHTFLLREKETQKCSSRSENTGISRKTGAVKSCLCAEDKQDQADRLSCLQKFISR